MKKYIYTVIVLASIGILVAGFLTYSHYYSGLEEKFTLCSGELPGNCAAQKEYKLDTPFGIPIAAYGLFIYLVIFFTMLLAEYAGGLYRDYALIILIPVVILSLLTDIFLFTVMIRLSAFCLLCIFTYLINLLLLGVALFWYRCLKKNNGFSLREVFSAILPKESDAPEKKLASALYVLFVLLLFNSVFFTTQLLQLKSLNQLDIDNAVKEFYVEKPQNLQLPESRLMIGNKQAKVKIVVFTDFLCSACYEFFQIEKELVAKYGDLISISYYNYPLDQSCNSRVKQTVNNGACTASKAFISAASLNIFQEYKPKHFSYYDEFADKYDKAKAVQIMTELTDTMLFEKEIDSDLVEQILQRDIEIAEKLDIQGTPTLFINGRRMGGVPPYEVLEAIISKELKS